jgi:protein phosphatase 2C-like protein
MKWKVFLASATGKYHLTNNTPCQDAGHYAVIEDVLIGVVCDGAGSSSNGQFGAEFFANQVIGQVAESIRSGQFAQAVQADYRDFLSAIIQAVRSQLNDIALSEQRELRDYACTLVGCILSQHGGCFFHIGDGFAIHMKQDGDSVLSHPENGEYSDETYFVTGDDWNEHLRLTDLVAINRGDLVGLMSDGASPFAVNRPKTGFFRPFIDPVVAFLRDATEHNGSQALHNVLADKKTFDITPDDKTLLLALAS